MILVFLSLSISSTSTFCMEQRLPRHRKKWNLDAQESLDGNGHPRSLQLPVTVDAQPQMVSNSRQDSMWIQ